MISLIAVIKAKENIIGYRFIQYETKEIIDVPKLNVYNALKSGTKIEGLCLDTDGSIKGSNGSIERYPYIADKKVKNSGKIIILAKLVSAGTEECLGYIVSDYKGTTKTVRKEDLIKYFIFNNAGIANGKLVKVGNNHFISAIFGEYRTEKIKKSVNNDNKIETSDKIEDKQEIKEKYNTNAYNTDYSNWEMPEFIEFMGENNLSFSMLQYNELILHDEALYKNKDNDKLMIKIPKGIASVRIELRELDIDTLIFCSDLVNMSCNRDIKNIIFGDNQTVLNISSRTFCHNFLISDKVEIIKNCEINTDKIDLSKCLNLEHIDNSFNQCSLTSIKLPNNIDTIKNSFQKCEVLVEISEIGATHITSSFCELLTKNINSIKIKDGNKTINYSFDFRPYKQFNEDNVCEMPRIDVPDSTRELIGFIGLSQLIKIPSNLRLYENSSSMKETTRDELEQLLSNKNLIHIGGIITPDYELILNNDNRLVSIEKCEFKKLDIRTSFGYNTIHLDRLKIKELELPNDIEILKEAIIGDCLGVELLDLRKYKNLKEIGISCFAFAKLNNLIFPSDYNMKDIRIGFNVKNVYLSDNLASVNDIASNYNTVFYCTRGSLTEKAMKKSKLNYVVVDSPEEMLDMTGIKLADRKISEAQLAKVRIFETDANLKSMLENPRYKNTADLITNLNAEINKPNKLNLFKGSPIEAIVKDITEESLPVANNFGVNIPIKELVTDTKSQIDIIVFKNIVKLLTDCLPKANIWVKDITKKTGTFLVLTTCIKADDNNYITMYLYNFRESNERLVIYYIVMDGVVTAILGQDEDISNIDTKFVGTIDLLSIAKNIKGNMHTLIYWHMRNLNEFLLQQINGKGILDYNIGRLLKPGDIISSSDTIKIGGITLPNYFRFCIKLLSETMILIDYNLNSYLLYDICNGNFIELMVINRSTYNSEYQVVRKIEYSDIKNDKKIIKALKNISGADNKLLYLIGDLHRDKVVANIKTDDDDDIVTHGEYYDTIQNILKGNYRITDGNFVLDFLNFEKTLAEVKPNSNNIVIEINSLNTDIRNKDFILRDYVCGSPKEGGINDFYDEVMMSDYRNTNTNQSWLYKNRGVKVSKWLEAFNKLKTSNKVTLSFINSIANNTLLLDRNGFIYLEILSKNNSSYLFKFKNLRDALRFFKLSRFNSGKDIDDKEIDRDIALAQLKENLYLGITSEWIYCNNNLNEMKRLILK